MAIYSRVGFFPLEIAFLVWNALLNPVRHEYSLSLVEISFGVSRTRKNPSQELWSHLWRGRTTPVCHKCTFQAERRQELFKSISLFQLLINRTGRNERTIFCSSAENMANIDCVINMIIMCRHGTHLSAVNPGNFSTPPYIHSPLDHPVLSRSWLAPFSLFLRIANFILRSPLSSLA